MTDNPDPARPSFARRTPDGDDRERLVCTECGFVDYENPKIVVGSVVSAEGGLLLCRRAIEPRKGYWTLPAGFLELNEAPEEGARREAREEACADIAIDRLLAVYSIPRISQVQLMYRARLNTPASGPAFAVGPESLEVRVFTWEEIPWSDLAFPSVLWALNHHRSVRNEAAFAPFAGAPDAEDPLKFSASG